MIPHHISDATFAALGVDRMISLVAVIENGGFSAAASVLGRSQSRISVHVTEIERVLGATLVDRSARPARATDGGKVMVAHIRRAFDELRAGAAHVGALQRLEEGEVRIGSFSSATISFLAGPLRSFRQLYPGVRVSVIEASASEIERAILSREISLAVCTSFARFRTPGIRRQSLWREQMMLVAPSEERLPCNSGRALVQHFEGRTVITVGEAPGRSRLDERAERDVDNVLASAGLSPEHILYTVRPQALIEMVRAGLGIGVASTLDLTGVERAGVRVFPVDEAGTQREVVLCWRDGGHFSEAERRLRGILASASIPAGTFQSAVVPS